MCSGLFQGTGTGKSLILAARRSLFLVFYIYINIIKRKKEGVVTLVL
jgi:hypothetical protein